MEIKKLEINFQTNGSVNKHEIEGIGSPYNILDKKNDVVLPGAFNNSLQEWQQYDQLPLMLYEHDLYAPIGIWKQMKSDHKGLYVSGKILPLLLEVLPQYDQDLILNRIIGLSIGYHVLDYYHENNIRYITKAILIEVSLVMNPANPYATFNKKIQ